VSTNQNKDNFYCPKCGKALAEVGQFLICPEHGQIDFEKPFVPMRIFLSYGHDANEELVTLIKSDLEERGHDVWIDKTEIKAGDDWRRSITEGIIASNQVLSFLSMHSTRDPGVCLDEIAIAIGVKGGNIQTILVESEEEIQPPTTVSHIQWLDMHDWKEKRNADDEVWKEWYQGNFAEIVRVVESDESARFAGEIETLNEKLKPISSDSRVRQLLKKGLVGRGWLRTAIENWRNNPHRSSRLFWLIGKPGVGKSAFAADLAHKGRGVVIAAHFCEHDKTDHRDPNRIVRTIAFQLATRLPDYRKLLLTLPEIGEVEAKDPSAVFDYLLADPMRQAIDGGRERYLIIIDALDEAKEKGRNELVEMLARNAQRLPEWIGIVVTSRPEEDVTKPLQGLNPFVLDTDTDDNRSDILEYLRRELAEPLLGRSDADDILERIAATSGRVFLLVERICLDVKEGHLSLDRVDEFPRSLGDTYWQFFKRQFRDSDKFRKDVRPALRAVLAAREPLPLEVLQRLSNWEDEELYDFTRTLGSLFPVTTVNGNKVIRHYHKSIADWVGDEAKAGPYYVSKKEGGRSLAEFGLKEFKSDIKGMSRYSLAHLPAHLCELELWDDLGTLLTDLNYIEKKCRAGKTYDLVQDYEMALGALPTAQEELGKQYERAEAVRAYSERLISYSGGKAPHLDPITAIRPWDQKRIDRESGRIKAQPSRFDHVKGFSRFVHAEAPLLAKYAKRPGYVIQQAFNRAASGPVAEAAEQFLEDYRFAPLLLRPRDRRPEEEPIPTLLRAMLGHDDRVLSLSVAPGAGIAVSGAGSEDLRRDQRVLVWDVSTGKLRSELKGHRGNVFAVGVSADGTRAISGDGPRTIKARHRSKVLEVEKATLQVWNPLEGQHLKELLRQDASIHSVSITPDGRQAVAGDSDGFITFWDLVKYEKLWRFKAHDRLVHVLVISATGTKALSCGDDDFAKLWHIQEGLDLFKVRDSENKALAASMNHRSRIISGSMTPNASKAIFGTYDNQILVWDMKGDSANELTPAMKDESEIMGVDVSADGTLAVAANFGGVISCWDLTSERFVKSVGKGYLAHQIWNVRLWPDGSLALVGGGDRSIRVLDLERGRDAPHDCIHYRSVRTMRTLPNGAQVVTASRDGSLGLWSLCKEECLKRIDVKEVPQRGLDITPDGMRVISGGSDNSLRIWDSNIDTCVKEIGETYPGGHQSKVESIVVSPDGRMFVSGEKGTKTLDSESKAVESTAETGGIVKIWDLEEYELVAEMKGHTSRAFDADISPDGKLAVTAGWDKTVRLWSLVEHKPIHTLEWEPGNINGIRFTPDGLTIVAGSWERSIIRWNMRTSEVLWECPETWQQVHRVVITPDGKKIISGHGDNTLRVSDTLSGELLAVHACSFPVTEVDYSLNLNLIAAASEAGNFWTIGYQDLCEKVPIVTGVRLWLFGDNGAPGAWDTSITTHCPWCAQRVPVSEAILDIVDSILRSFGLSPDKSPDKSPCLLLPNEVWDEPRLIDKCPECKRELKFNPFIVDNMRK